MAFHFLSSSHYINTSRRFNFFFTHQLIMKKYILFLVTAVIAFVVYFTANKPDFHRKKIVKFTSEELIQKQINKKIERRKRGYAKPDQPDKYVQYKKMLTSGYGKNDYGQNYKLTELKSAVTHKAELKAATVSLPWQQRGPGNVGGRTRTIAVDPDDASGQTWYAGAISGGIWKTTNAGNSWQNISPDMPNLSIASLVFAPSNSNVIYAGTGEGYYSIDAVRGQGIFKSTDKGVTWNQLAFTATHSWFHYINTIVVSSTDENLVWASTNDIVMKSVDGGINWTNITPEQGSMGRYQKLILHPANDNVLWVALNDNGIYKTENGGESWFQVKDLSGVGRIELTISKTNPDKLYAMDSNSLLYYSFDGGYSWAQGVESGAATEFLGEQGWYNNVLAVNPDDANKGFIGGIDLYSFTVGNEVTDKGNLAYSISNGLSSNIDFDNFKGTHAKGGVVFYEAFSGFNTNIEIQFGTGRTQKAHRLSHSISPESFSKDFSQDKLSLSYEDYVDVPFKIVNTSTNKQLNASFIDYNGNGVFDLYENSYEVIIVYNSIYNGTAANASISASPGSYQLLTAVYPQLPEGALWNESSLPTSSITLSSYELKDRTLTAEKLTNWAANTTASDYSHADHHNITVVNVGSPFSLIVGNDGGVGYSNDGGTTWDSKSNGYVTSQFYGISRHPYEYRYFGGLQDNGSYISGANPTVTSDWTEALGGDGFDVLWHSREPNRLMGSIYYNSISVSEDGGSGWSDVSELIGDNTSDNAPFLTKVAGSKIDPNLVFVGGASGLWKSANFGINWKNIPMGDKWAFGSGSPKISISEADPDIVWAGNVMNSDNSYSIGNIHVSVDGGETFTAVPNAMDLGDITNIVTHPTEPNTAYAIFSYADYPKIFRTTDLGQNWEDISGFGLNGAANSSNGFPDVAVNTMLVMPFDTNELWAGTEIGLFISTDNGNSWTYADNGIPAVSIWDMKIVGDEIIVGTHGLGVWTVKRDGLRNAISNPYIQGIGVIPSGNIVLETVFDVDLDSVEIYLDDNLYTTSGNIKAGTQRDTLYSTMTGTQKRVQMRGYQSGMVYYSNSKDIPSVNLLDPVIAYSNDFSDRLDDFYGNGFSINANDVGNNAITTSHPYGQNDEFIYTLKYPVVVKSDFDMAFIKYVDIAYVESGEKGSAFSDSDFYDYVVVEGTKDGINWLPLKDGYDFTYSSKWDDGINSYGDTPDAMQYVEHVINLHDTFSAQDTILIRFRLHSDPLETGWGWAIDFLRIQEEVSGIFDDTVSSFELQLSPNPTSRNFDLIINDLYTGSIELSIYTMNGKMAYHNSYFKGNDKFIQPIQPDISVKGTYLVTVKMGDKLSSEKLIIK